MAFDENDGAMTVERALQRPVGLDSTIGGDMTFVTPRFTDTKDRNAPLVGCHFTIDKTWDGLPIDHDPFHVHLWFFARIAGKPHKRVVKVFIEGPLFDDPEPPDEMPGICPNLWDYECVELFFANVRDQYLEVQVGPHGHWLVYLHDGIRKPFNKGEELELNVQNTFEGNTWRCTVEIPLAYFPAMRKLNLYSVHGSGSERHYEALNAVTDGTKEKPDFHLLDFYEKIDMRQIIPEGYNDTPFNDLLHGDLWQGKQ